MPGQIPRRPIDGPGGTQPQSFGARFAPQIQRIQQMYPGFADRARQQWRQARQEQGPGFWRNYMKPGGGPQQMYPGFLNLFQNVMGHTPPQRFTNYAQRRGWAPGPSVPPGERPGQIPGRLHTVQPMPDPMDQYRRY
jgi:hypothetical protein